MSPPPTTPRLTQLEPRKVARDVCAAVSHQFEKLAAVLGHEPPKRHAPEHTTLGATVVNLTVWAKTGTAMHVTEAEPAIALVRDALYSHAGVLGRDVTPDLDAALGDPKDAISCVLLAAAARIAVHNPRTGKLVRARWLAALGSVAESRIHQLAAEGKLSRVDSAIQTRDARRWLVERGVPGFAAN